MQSAYNPKTGEVLFLVDNQWVKPTQTATNPKTGENAYLVNNAWQVMPMPGGKPTDRTWGEALITDPLSSLLGGAGTAMGSPGQLSQLITGEKPSEEKPKGTIESLAQSLLPFGTEPSKVLDRFIPTKNPTPESVISSVSSPFGGLQPVGEELQTFGERQKSAGLKAAEKGREKAIQEAEGFFPEVGAAVGQTLKNPALLSNFIFEQIPNFAGTLGGGAVSREAVKAFFKDATEKTIGRVGVGGAVATGAAMQAGDIGSETYQTIYDRLVKEGTPQDQAHQIALEKGRMAAAQAGAISIASSFIPGGQALEKRFLTEAGKKAGFPGLVPAVGNILGETVQEGTEEGGGKLVSNLQLAQVFPDTDVMKGVGAATGLGALGGGMFGGISNIPSALSRTPQEQPAVEGAPPVPPAAGAQPVPPGVPPTSPVPLEAQLEETPTSVRLFELQKQLQDIDEAFKSPDLTADDFRNLNALAGQIRSQIAQIESGQGVTGVTPTTTTAPKAAEQKISKINVPIFDDNGPTGEIDEVDLNPNTLYFEDGEVYALGNKIDHPIDNLLDELPDSPEKQALFDAAQKLIAENTKPKEAPKAAEVAPIDLKSEQAYRMKYAVEAIDKGETALNARNVNPLAKELGIKPGATPEETLANVKQALGIEVAPESAAPKATEVVEEPPETVDSTNPENIKKATAITAKFQNNEDVSREESDFHLAVMRDVMSKEEKLKSPPISKKSVIPIASIEVAPFNGGYVSSFSYNEFTKGLGIGTPLDINTIYPTRQEAIDAVAKEVRDRAEKDGNKTALKWLDTVATPVAPKKTQAEINKARQAEKKAAAAKAKEPVDMSAVKDLIEGKVKKFQGYTIYKRKEDPDFWYVQSRENKAANKIGPGDEASTNLDTAKSKVEDYVYRDEAEGKPKVEVKPTEKKAAKEEKQKAPEKEDKAIEKIKSNMVRFASGMSGLSDLINGSFTRAKHKNYGVGFDVGLLSKNAIKELAHFVVNMDTQVFVDSGAFSHFRKQLKGKDVGELDFDKILAKYDAITEAISEENAAEKQDYPRPLFVMPDVVGDQKASLELVKKYADWIGTEVTFNASKPIVPIQKGELTLSEVFDKIMDELNTNKFIVGIPSNESAVSRQDLIDFLRESRPHYIHFLGAAADSKINPLIELVAMYSPGTEVTADASKVRSAILNGVAKGKTRSEAIKDALYEEEDPMVVMNALGKEGKIEANKARQEEKKAAKEVKPVEVKKPSTAVVPKLDEEWASHRKEPLKEKPYSMDQEVWDRYQELQKGNFAFEKVSFTGAHALARANAANKERKKVYEKAIQEFLRYPITAKAPTKNQPKLEISDYISGTFPPPISKNIKVAKTLEDKKKALLSIAAPKDDVRKMLQGILVEPNKLVATDGHRLAMYKTDTGVAEKTLLDKDNKVIDMQYPNYERIFDKFKNTKSYGMVNAEALGNYVRGTRNAWKYVSSNKNSPFSIQFKNGDTPIPFNGRYIEDMANLFRQFGYDGFDIQYNDSGILSAVSPDGKLTQVVMGVKDLNLLFQPFNIEENRPGLRRTTEEQAKFRKELGLSEEVEEKEIKAEEPGVVVDDEGEKLTFPLFVDLANKGYKVLGFDNPRTYENKGGKKFRTIEKDGVRLAFEPSHVLFADPKYPNRPPQLGYGNPNQIVWQFLGVDKDQRKQGKATQAIKDIIEVADKNGYTIYGEPAQLETESMTAEQLSKFYGKFGFQPKTVSSKIIARAPQISDETRTIDVEATEITEEQIMLLTDETSKLSKKEMDTLESHYGMSSDSETFFKLLREDIIKYVNKGADAVDAAIRDIIKKLQAGVLAVAMVFNPAYMSQQSAVVYPSTVTTEQVKAVVPESAKDMSESGKKAFAAIFPAIKPSMAADNKLFTVVDKPTSKVYVFQPDGSLLVKDNVVLGMAMGDTYVGATDYKGNRITPAGLFKVKGEKGSGTYDGKTIYTVGNVKEGWNTAFMHTVYLKESDAEARKQALATGEKTRLSHGCVNASPEVMAKIGADNRMDGSHVFVVPDNQAKVDDYIANNVSNEDLTRETVTPVTEQVPSKQAAAIKPAEIVGREEKALEPKTKAQINRERQLAKLAKTEPQGTFYNNFEPDFTEEDFNHSVDDVRKEKIKEQAVNSRRITAAVKKIADMGSDLTTQYELNRALNAKKALAEEIEARKQPKRLPEDVMAKAGEDRAEFVRTGGIDGLSPEAYAVLEALYKKYPNILNGLKLSVRRTERRGVTGSFEPIERLVTVYKKGISAIFGGAGEKQAKTMRHEITHSLEQMMNSEARKVLVNAWANSLQKAIKKHEGDQVYQDYFNAVLDFIEKPSEATYRKATDLMPEYNMYQYISPSEFWAVNAEPLLDAQLGGAWARFTKAVKGLWEAIKSVFGFDNRYAVHREFNRIMSGDQQRMTKSMLVDYLDQTGVSKKFINNIEEDLKLIEDLNLSEVPEHEEQSMKDMAVAGYRKMQDMGKDFYSQPGKTATKSLLAASEAATQFRIDNIFFAAGVEDRDIARYKGKIKAADGLMVASLAIKNAIHAAQIAVRVVKEGALEYSAIYGQFIAKKSEYSMANVFKLQHKLKKKIGKKNALKIIQAYFIGKRTRSIQNQYFEASAALEAAKETGDFKQIAEAQTKYNSVRTALSKVPKFFRQLNEDGKPAYETIEDDDGNIVDRIPILNDDAIDRAIGREKDHPELAEMMKNWTEVNHNMLDMLALSGRISKKSAEELKKIKDYVPWYRIMDDQEDIMDGKLMPAYPSSIRRFKGGETDRDIDNVVESMMHNITMMTRSTTKTYAINRVISEYGQRYEEGPKKGKLMVFPTEGRDANGTRIATFMGGRRVVVNIPDNKVADGALGLLGAPFTFPLQDVLGAAANGLRRSITFTPWFQLKQAFIDAPTAAWVSGVRNPFKLWAGCFKGFYDALEITGDDPIVTILKNAGVGGFQSFHRTAKKERDIELGLMTGSNYAAFLNAIDHVGDASDLSQRVAIYKRVLAETGDHALALLQASDVIDFQKHGKGRMAQVMRTTVTFMQAYATQIDALAQASIGGGLKGKSRREAFKQFRNTGLMLASVTLLYAMMAGADDDYWELDDQTRLRNIYIPGSKKATGHHVLIPLTTSAAFFFKSIPEMLHNKIVKEGTKDEIDWRRTSKALGKAAVDSLLGPFPFPTGAKPFAEIALNHDFFTGGNVVPRGMEDLEAAEQYTASTSELGHAVSALSGRTLSPIQADHLMRGMGGSVATLAMYFSNMVFGENRPEPELSKNPIIGNLIGPEVSRKNEELFYDLKDAAIKKYKTYQKKIDDEKFDEAEEYYDKNEKLITAYDYVSTMETDLKEINKEIRRLGRSADKTLTSEERTKEINELKRIKSEMLDDIEEFRKEAGL